MEHPEYILSIMESADAGYTNTYYYWHGIGDPHSSEIALESLQRMSDYCNELLEQLNDLSEEG